MTIRFCFDVSLFIKLMASHTFLVLVLLMRKVDRKLGDVLSLNLAGTCNVTKTRKQKTRRIARRHFDVAIRADSRRWSLPRKELPAMAIETTLVFGKLRDIRKRCISLAHVFPVGGGKFMARVARRFRRINVSAMGELRVVDTRSLATAGLCVEAQHKQQCDDEGRRR
jgi:hypothetical protein